MRALILPRGGAEAGDHWYRFLAKRIDAGAVAGLTGAEIRSPGEEDADAAGSLLLIAHADAASEAQSFVSGLPGGRGVAGVLLVAPPPAEADWRGAGRLRVLLSDAPGYEQAEHSWAERHGAEVSLRPRGRSFYGAHEISVLINLAALAMEVAESGLD